MISALDASCGCNAFALSMSRCYGAEHGIHVGALRTNRLQKVVQSAHALNLAEVVREFCFCEHWGSVKKKSERKI